MGYTLATRAFFVQEFAMFVEMSIKKTQQVALISEPLMGPMQVAEGDLT